MVVDTSVLLAILFAEQHAEWAVEKLHQHATELRMSTVNLTEVLIRVKDRQPQLYESIRSELLAGGLRFVPPDTQQAETAAEARLLFPLNLGDCFAYALAVAEDCAILTLDRDFRAVDRPLVLPGANRGDSAE